MNFLDNIITIGMTVVIALIVLANIGAAIFAAILSHWFICAIIIGVLVFIFAGQRVEAAIASIIVSAIILGILNLFFVPESPKVRNQDQFEERQERARKEREEQEWIERQVREQQERERQERQERERQQALERQESERQEQERRERERQEKAAANVYNKILTDYYQAISEHRFYEAYSLLSDKEQQHQGSLEGFAAGRQDTSDIKILKFKITDERNTTVLADYQIRTKDKDGNGFIVRTFNGNVTFTKIAGTWKIDALSSKKVDERRE